MKKFAATKTCRFIPSLGTPNTRVIGAGSGTVVMWQSWHVFLFLKSLLSHSLYGICSGSEPTGLPSGPKAVVISVWQVAHSSDLRKWSLPSSVGSKPPVDDCMIRTCPGSILKGPYSRRTLAEVRCLISKPPLKLSRVPRLGCADLMAQ